MKRLNLVTALVGAALMASLAGCGSDNRETAVTAQVQASQACIACHSGTMSPVTGNSIVTEYLRSAHSTAFGGAGCNDCHQVDGHPGNGAIPAIPNDLVCVTCHTKTVPISAAHFGTISTASYTGLPLSRLADGLVNPATGDPSASSCNGCHNPHDMTSLLSVNQQWAASAHGAINDDPFREEGSVKSSTCSRCHSATGFRYYVTHGQATVTAAILGKYSSAREAIGCYGCHSNYSWKRISTDPSVTNFINYSTPYVRFANVTKRIPGSNFPSPDVGDTKVCIPCHAGRSGARSGAAITMTRTTAPFDSHYFAAAAVMYGKIAFINFTSQSAVIGTSTYGKSLITSEDLSGGVTSTHRKLGTTAINGDSHNPSFFVPGNLDSNGPCVVCHMALGPNKTAGHTWQITPDTYNAVCINCHTSERGTPLNANNFLSVFVDENREQMNNALALAVKFLENNYDITVQLADIESPQESSLVRKSDGSSVTSTTGWAAWLASSYGSGLTDAQVYKLKGAMYNILLCYKENASFVHARTITRRVIYDTIDFLDDGAMNLSVGASALGPVGQTVLDSAGNKAFGKGATAFVDSTLTALAPGTTPSMTYILGFSRTTGAWTTPERP